MPNRHITMRERYFSLWRAGSIITAMRVSLRRQSCSMSAPIIVMSIMPVSGKTFDRV